MTLEVARQTWVASPPVELPTLVDGSPIRSVDWRIEQSRLMVQGLIDGSLNEIRSRNPIDPYEVAKNSNQREMFIDGLFRLRFPQSYLLMTDCLTDVTRIPTSNRTSTMEHMWRLDNYIKTKGLLGGTCDVKFTARAASASSYIQRLLRSNDLSEKIRLTSQLDGTDPDFGIFGNRLAELETNLMTIPQFRENAKALLTEKLTTDPTSYHDIIGGSFFAPTVWEFNRVLENASKLPGFKAMHKIEENGKELDYTPISPEDIQNGYGNNVLKAIWSSKSPYPVYSAAHLRYKNKGSKLTRELKVMFDDPTSFILKANKAESRALRTKGIGGTGLTPQEIETLKANETAAAVALLSTKKRYSKLPTQAVEFMEQETFCRAL